MALIHGFELQGIEPPFGLEQRHAVLLFPQCCALRPRIDLRRRRALDGLEIQVQPRVGSQRVELRPVAQLRDRFARREGADKVLLVPAREDDQFARSVMHARTHHRGIPLPTVGTDQRRIGLQGILVEVVEDEAIDPVARKRTFAADRKQSAPATDDLHLVGRTDVAGRLGALFDGRGGKQRLVFARFEDALHAAVEFRSQSPRIGGDRNPAIGIEPQHVGRKQGRGADALAVLRRHGDDQPTDAPSGEGLQHPIIGPVKGLKFEERVDLLRERREGGRFGEKVIPRYENLCGGMLRRGRKEFFRHKIKVGKPLARRRGGEVFESVPEDVAASAERRIPKRAGRSRRQR